MTNLTINVPDWFLYVVAGYLIIKASFNIISRVARTRAKKLARKVSRSRRRFK